ncbi:MAG TPA: hypothetical protein VF988_03875 [Verrucomicrobiae bacterium]
MFKQFKALGVAGLTTLSTSQFALALPNNVLWSPDKANAEVKVSEIKAAARAISQLNEQRPLVRFTHNSVGGSAVVPLLPSETDGRCSPDFDFSPFQAEKGNEVWAHFEFLNIDETDRDLLAFTIKADKPGCKDRYRINHDIGLGRAANKAAMTALITPPTEGDYGYYFMDRGLLKSDELLLRNPGAAIKITVSNRARGKGDGVREG